MREIFPQKRKGDSLGAGHVNRLSDVATRFSRSRPGTNQYGRHSDGGFYSASLSPGLQLPLIVSALSTTAVTGVTDANDSGYYLVKQRYYNFDTNAWVTDDSGQWVLDATEGSGELLAVGDKVTGFWTDQRGAFLLTAGGSGGSAVHFGQLTGDVAHNATGTFTKYTDASTTGDTLTVLNLTGETLKANVWMKAWTPDGWTDNALVEPYELDECPLV